MAFSGISDNFNDSSLNATYWASSVSGSGTVVEGTSGVTLTAPAAADAAILVLNQACLANKTEIYSITSKNTAVGTLWRPIALNNKASTAPTVASAGNVRFYANASSTTNLRVIYVDTGGGSMYWDQTNNIWTASVINNTTDLTLSHTYTITTSSYGVKMTIYRGTTKIIDTPYIAWTALQSPSTSLWCYAGDINTAANTGTQIITNFSYTIPTRRKRK